MSRKTLVTSPRARLVSCAFLLLSVGWKFLMPRVLLISRRIGRPENQLSSGAGDKSVDGPLRRAAASKFMPPPPLKS